MAEWQNENRPVLLDVRETYEWQQMHVPGSQHMPMNQLPAQLHKLDKAADIVVICATGNRSYSVTAFLQQNGFRARNLQGGIMRWARSGGQVESGQ
ncbi:MAG: rhodanese-like domain-containing protein [Chloroflexi bacterium]|nr:rhodanese-like domain-containing protein [Chloroflexota bacterium]